MLFSGVQFAAHPSPPKARHSPPGHCVLPVQAAPALLPPTQVPPSSHCSPASTTPLQQLLAGTVTPPHVRAGLVGGVLVGRPLGVAVTVCVGVFVDAGAEVFVGVPVGSGGTVFVGVLVGSGGTVFVGTAVFVGVFVGRGGGGVAVGTPLVAVNVGVNAVHVEGWPLQLKPLSTWHPWSQPSPPMRLPSSQVS